MNPGARLIPQSAIAEYVNSVEPPRRGRSFIGEVLGSFWFRIAAVCAVVWLLNRFAGCNLPL